MNRRKWRVFALLFGAGLFTMWLLSCYDTKKPIEVIRLLLGDTNLVTNVVYADRKQKDYIGIVRLPPGSHVMDLSRIAEGGILDNPVRLDQVKNRFAIEFHATGMLAEPRLSDCPIYAGRHYRFPYFVYALQLEDQLFLIFSRY